MRGRGEQLDVEHRERGVCYGLAKHALGVGPKRGVQLLARARGRNERCLHPHLAHGVRQEVVRPAIDGGARHHVVAALADVEEREERGRLARGRQHGRRAALQLADLLRDRVVGGVLQAGVEVAVLLKVEQAPHVLRGVVLEGGGLHDGQLPGLAVPGNVAALHARGLDGAHERLPARWRPPTPWPTGPQTYMPMNIYVATP